MISLIGRVGILAKPNTLVYGLVGPTEAKYLLSTRRDWKLGVTSGAGFEHKFNEHWSVLAEYRFTHLNFNDLNDQNVTNSAFGTNLTSVTTTGLLQTVQRNLNINAGNFAVVYRI
ncbi:hypothetical protein TUM19329_08290 [Legionella antarctica]|uniref:Outer membrane protein beta-barrel domain-containing protein n=1 Tax=Legionella antarctica TaxID=2708020 RepID=A0A6F8T252_9GAMM|nr:outer membrane beta-barrel protein [Legionella antarctica]BCA94468.1 hypothetical protein TUM19329_08290 [Legionella antarctica]